MPFFDSSNYSYKAAVNVRASFKVTFRWYLAKVHEGEAVMVVFDKEMKSQKLCS